MTEILDLKIESVSPRSEGYTDYQEFKNNHYIDDDNVGANVFSNISIAFAKPSFVPNSLATLTTLRTVGSSLSNLPLSELALLDIT